MQDKKYKVRLTSEERESLHKMTSTGKGAARKLAFARVLLACDERDGQRGPSDGEVAERVQVSRSTVERVRRTFVLEGLERALNAKRPRQTPSPNALARRAHQRRTHQCSMAKAKRR